MNADHLMCLKNNWFFFIEFRLFCSMIQHHGEWKIDDSYIQQCDFSSICECFENKSNKWNILLFWLFRLFFVFLNDIRPNQNIRSSVRFFARVTIYRCAAVRCSRCINELIMSTRYIHLKRLLVSRNTLIYTPKLVNQKMLVRFFLPSLSLSLSAVYN